MTDLEKQQQAYKKIGYGGDPIGFGKKTAVIVIDFMRASTRAGDHPFSQKPLVMRAFENTKKILAEARRLNQPVVNCNTAYNNEREMPHWKIPTVRDTYRFGNEDAEIDPEINDPDYDLTITKRGVSIFFETPAISYLIKNGVDTCIITGINTSGCVRAAIIDSFQHGFRTIVPEDCVGDFDEVPHYQNLADVGRRYADVVKADDVLEFYALLSAK